jgi:manganese transport system ATP-binding protein
MTPAVTATGVEIWRGSHPALGISTFEIPTAAQTAVIGPNGAGKSTLLEAIVGLHPLRSGRIEVLGTDPAEARRRVAFVPQSTKVNEALPVTVREVVEMGRFSTRGAMGRLRSEDRQAVEGALELLELGPLTHRHLHELSGGQRQRVFVAQGLAQAHDLLLMDEPLTGLDLVSAEVITAAIAQERETGCTVVVTTHDLHRAEEADHVLLLAGRVVAQGAPAQVLTLDRLSSAYRSAIPGRVMIDDAAHHPAGVRHVHVDRAETTHPH